MSLPPIQSEHHPRPTGGGAGFPLSPPPGRDRRLPPRTRRVLHLDVDAFLASVEQVVHPELRGRPVVIGGLPTERNIVMSCTYDTRARGVHPGMLLIEAARRCPDAVFRRGDSQAANRLREDVARLLMRYSPLVEIASIDDFFVELRGTERLFGSAFEVAERIQREVRHEIGLPLTVGVATNRTLARLAGKLAKPAGVAEVLPGYEESFLRGLPVDQLPGVGYSTKRLLEQFSIRTVGELALVSREVLFASFGSLGLLLWERARGVDEDPVVPSWVPDAHGGWKRRVPRSIRRDSTFEPEEGRRELVEAMLSYLVERAGHVLRLHSLLAGSLEVRVIYVDTRPPSMRRAVRDEGAHRHLRRKLAHPSDSTDALWQHARELFRELPRRRALTKRVGVTLLGLRASGGVQTELFGEPGSDRCASLWEHPTAGRAADTTNAPTAGAPGSRGDRQRRLDAAIDRLRTKLGFGRILRGASLPLIESCELEPEGFRLRTPSLNQ